MTQNFITIWFDRPCAQDSSIEIYQQIHAFLCRSSPYLITFRNSNDCADYISNVDEEKNKIILIVSSRIPFLSPDTLLNLAEDLPQIDSVYILYSNEMSAKNGGDNIYTTVQSLCLKLNQIPNVERHRRKGFVRDDFNINSLSSEQSASAVASILNQLPSLLKNDSTKKRQEADFMYASLLRDILIAFETAESTEKEMVDFCRQKCANSESDLKIVDELEWYNSSNSIIWYTRDTFLYRLLNKAVRELDADTLYALRHFIKDLNLQLKKRHNSQQTGDSRVETVYRGQRMKTEEFNKKIRNNVGGFFSVSGFLSTTRLEALANIYAGEPGSINISAAEEKEEHVIFEIGIDKTIDKFPYADIANTSAFGETEEEFLFTMGAVFRIQSANKNEKGVWSTKLVLTGEEDHELSTLTEHMRKDITMKDPLGSLGKLMLMMGNYEKAKKYLLMLLEEPSINNESASLSAIYNELGLIYKEIGQYEQAIEKLEQSIDSILQNFSANHLLLALPYNNLGEIYREKGNYNKALTYYFKALKIEKNTSDPDQPRIAILYNNAGIVYEAKHEFLEALKMHENSLKIRLRTLPPNHPHIAHSYNNLAMVCKSLGRYNKAIKYLKATLRIELNSLTRDHPNLASTYNNLGVVFHLQGKRSKSLKMYKKSGAIKEKFLPNNHLSLAKTLSNIATNYLEKGEHDKACDYYMKAIEHHRTSTSPNHQDLVTLYNNISTVWIKTGEYDEAIQYLYKALQIQLVLYKPSDPQVLQTYKNLAQTYRSLAQNLYQQHLLKEALENAKKSLENELKVLTPNDPNLAELYIDIFTVCKDLDEKEQAEVYYNKALSCLSPNLL